MSEPDIKVRAGVDATGVNQGLEQMKAQFRAFSDSVGQQVSGSFAGVGKIAAGSVAGALSFEGLKSAIEGLIQKASGLRQMSEAMDMNADATQRWEKAVDRIGRSMGGFMNIVNAISSKRTEAATSKSARAELKALGFTDEEILDRDKMSSEDFIEKAFKGGRSGDKGRRAFGQVVGRRGIAYLPAFEQFERAQATLTPEELEQAHEIELMKKKVGGWTSKALLLAAKLNPSALGNRIGKWLTDPFKDPGSEALPLDPTRVANRKHGPVEDPIETAELEKEVEKEQKLKNELREADQHLRETMRHGMSKSDRRADVEAEMAELRERMKYLREGLTDDDTAGQLKMRKMQTQYATLADSIKEKPMSFTPDSMAKVGLYSASSLAYNPVLGVAQQQLRVLHSIDRHLGARRDTFAH